MSDGTGILRKATLQDVDGILAVIDANLDKLLPRTREDTIPLLDSFYVIDEDRVVVGCACLEVYSPKIAEIRSLAVLAEHRGHEYGAMLVKQCIADAQRLKIRQILVVTSTPEFFEKMDFGLCLNEKYAMFWSGVTPESYRSPVLSSAIFHQPVNGNTGSGKTDTAKSTPPAPAEDHDTR
ncbi:MAG: GNAT family N-acetyltransferase [Aggregatilineales bacterium]